VKNQGLLGFLLPAKQLSLMGRSPGLSSTSLVQISLESPADFISQPRSMVLGRVPHVRPSVHGPKTDFSNAFTPCATILALRRSLLPAWQKRWKGCAPSFSAHVRSSEHGAPVQGSWPCCWLKGRAAHFFIASVLTQPSLHERGVYAKQAAEKMRTGILCRWLPIPWFDDPGRSARQPN
jgi:hypothetical protein